MENQTEKLTWFNSLPAVRMRHEPVETERTCPCGETIWYQNYELTLDMSSWIDIHFEHRLEEKTVGKSPDIGGAEYDFTRPIKFSKAGFDAFVVRFGLQMQFSSPMSDLYTDEQGREFFFVRHCRHYPPPSDYEGVFTIFNNKASNLKVNAE